MTSSRRYSAIGKFLGVFAVVAAGAFAACNNSQGDTDGGSAVGNLGTGNNPVSDGGFGAKLEILVEADDDILHVGEVTGYFVKATDPKGLPLANRRVFCDSEKGVAILEPSSGGVAFEHTGDDGRMSGKIAGVTQGSYLFECRLEEGFNLTARKHLRVRGVGVASYPGAAGGNLGGGQIVPGFGVSGATATPSPTPTPTGTPTPTPTATPPPKGAVPFKSGAVGAVAAPVAGVSVASVYFEGTGAQETSLNFATVNNVDHCSASSEGFTVVLSNDTGLSGVVEDVRFVVGGVESGQQVNAALSTGVTKVSGSFTENGSAGKVFAGTSVAVPAGTSSVTFTATVKLSDGTTKEVSGSTTVDFGAAGSC